LADRRDDASFVLRHGEPQKLADNRHPAVALSTQRVALVAVQRLCRVVAVECVDQWRHDVGETGDAAMSSTTPTELIAVDRGCAYGAGE
jgi:hypothetical protein